MRFRLPEPKSGRISIDPTETTGYGGPAPFNAAAMHPMLSQLLWLWLLSSYAGFAPAKHENAAEYASKATERGEQN